MRQFSIFDPASEAEREDRNEWQCWTGAQIGMRVVL